MQTTPTTNYPSQLLEVEKSVCRVRVTDRDGAFSNGSGILLKAPDAYPHLQSKHYVLTAHHVVCDRRTNESMKVTWDGENWYDAKISACRPGCDAAILEATDKPAGVKAIPMANKEVQRNEKTYGYGFGSTRTNTLRCATGHVIVFTANIYGDPVWFDMSGYFRNGDSGGPVLAIRDGIPVVIGCGWGSNGRTIAVTRLCVLRRLWNFEEAPTYKASPSNMFGTVRYSPGSRGGS